MLDFYFLFPRSRSSSFHHLASPCTGRLVQLFVIAPKALYESDLRVADLEGVATFQHSEVKRGGSVSVIRE